MQKFNALELQTIELLKQFELDPKRNSVYNLQWKTYFVLKGKWSEYWCLGLAPPEKFASMCNLASAQARAIANTTLYKALNDDDKPPT